MKAVRNFFDKLEPHVKPGGKYEKLYALYETFDTFHFTPNHTTPAKGAQIRDAIDLKRMMMTVIIAMIPAILMGVWNVGYMHELATGGDPYNHLNNVIIGLGQFLPILITVFAAGLGIELIFSIRHKHGIHEGFLVSGPLIALTMPPDIPLWQVALGTAFAVLVAKEVFGGTGMNILNIALTARAFLYFAYPTDISGNVWILGADQTADVYSGATALGMIAQNSQSVSDLTPVDYLAAQGSLYQPEGLSVFESLLIGLVPGSIGEVSTLAIAIGAFILIFTGVASWRIIVACVIGALVTGYFLNWLVPYVLEPTAWDNHYMALPAHYHLVLGGFAFATVFMATDPVSASHTFAGKWIYGLLIGALTVLIRVFNPAYPEGVMLAILLMNVLAPLIDFYVVDANKKRRLKRATI